MQRLAGFTGPLNWLNTDEVEWENKARAWQPEYMVHSAWLGVSASQRDDWDSQLTNLEFTVKLLQIMAAGPARQIIALGSQAEYGNFHGRIAEDTPANPNTAYGAVKVATLDVLRAFCQVHGLNWHWLRVFAVFGPREDAHWFVSHVVNKLLHEQTLDLTGCEQQYDYTYVRDLARAIIGVLGADATTNGVYNVSANTALPLKKIVQAVQILTQSDAEINYGAIPYRPGQVMHLEGDSDRFAVVFGPVATTPLSQALTETITFVKETA
ncbi:MAG: NAD(P)-dependent oxidoreductase [Hymenobacter sp.]|nr:MAG: NAD(P)-dependent oxidoreductase [Hymenobacter sp.]